MTNDDNGQSRRRGSTMWRMKRQWSLLRPLATGDLAELGHYLTVLDHGSRHWLHPDREVAFPALRNGQGARTQRSLDLRRIRGPGLVDPVVVPRHPRVECVRVSSLDL